jgi:hypothetical protein
MVGERLMGSMGGLLGEVRPSPRSRPLAGSLPVLASHPLLHPEAVA